MKQRVGNEAAPQQPSPPEPCVDADLAAAYVSGQLSAVETEQVDVHIDTCASCRRLLSELARMSPRALTAPSVGSTPGSATPQATPVLLRGSQVGRYVIEGLLGVGGMGVVYAARDPELDRRVALKRVRGDLARGEAAQNRLLQEAQAMARLSHPNVVSVFDLVVHAQHLFIAMELVSGVSLRRWLEEGKREWGAVVERFVEAGRGLAAAHAVGLVHGDFKADNVLCDETGRARVTDFGLSRTLLRSTDAETKPTPERAVAAHAASAGAPSISRSRALGGTPAYMAPELLEGGPGDERSDQFAFCVALYEALYDQRPFAGASPAELSAAARAGKVSSPPTGTSVPAWLRASVLRGLHADPAARHPSLRALLSSLEPRPPRRRRRATLLGLALALTGAVLGALLFRSWEARAASRACDAAGNEARDDWNGQRADQVRASFMATGSSFAEAAFIGVQRALDSYTAEWARARADACRATRVTGTQSEQLLALRAQCFTNQRRALGALADTLTHADAPTVETALAFSESLPEVSRCDGDRVVRDPTSARVTPAQANVGGLREALVGATTRAGTGHVADALAAATAAESRASAIGDPVLESEALWTLGSIEDRADDWHGAETTLRRAVTLAERTRDDAVVADASTLLAEVIISEGGSFERADDWASRAEVALERLGDDPARLAAILDARRFVLAQTGRYDDALAALERELSLLKAAPSTSHLAFARALRRRAQLLANLGRLGEALAAVEQAAGQQSLDVGPAHPEVGRTERIWGDVLTTAGRFAEAIDRLEDARRILVDSPSPSRHELVETLNSLANAYEGRGDYEKALAANVEAGALAEQAFGSKDRSVGRAYSNRSLIYLDLGRNDEAISAQQTALTIWRELLGPTHPDVGNAECSLGEAFLAAKRPAEAVGVLRTARGALESSLGPEHPRVGIVLTTLGEALIETHAATEAIGVLERAVAIETAHPDNPLYLPWSSALLGRALLLGGGDRERARQLVAAALVVLPTLGVRGGELAARVKGWKLSV